MGGISHWLYNYFLSLGFSENAAKYTNMVVLLVAILILLLILDYSIRKSLRTISNRIAKKSRTNFDDLLVANKVPRYIGHIIPLILAFKVTPLIFTDFKPYERLADTTLHVLVVVLTLWIVRAVLNTFKDYFKTLPRFKDKPIDSYIQVFMIFAWIVGLMSMLAIVTGVPFFKFLTGLGAASAVILLIFRDSILGFVASIQVSINDMVRIGDWITFDKYEADGDVIEINLSTVKVQNFDKTITTIPTYALISDSFRNWRGMMSSDGRRIKRAVKIKQHSVRFLNDDDIVRLKNIEIISNYLEKKDEEIDEYNLEGKINKEFAVNGRNLTNLGVFRMYLDAYLKQHKDINQNMTIMARQLAPTAQGVPLEVYAFTKDKTWANYEYIMADIFDHIIASVKYFDLELFELPTEGIIISE
ncbi:MAG: mechanosensitive ion channel [Bacteroidia bacterium]|nr:mechanosensitive ion channel [Bacteroidia bacterium]